MIGRGYPVTLRHILAELSCRVRNPYCVRVTERKSVTSLSIGCSDEREKGSPRVPCISNVVPVVAGKRNFFSIFCLSGTFCDRNAERLITQLSREILISFSSLPLLDCFQMFSVCPSLFAFSSNGPPVISTSSS